MFLYISDRAIETSNVVLAIGYILSEEIHAIISEQFRQELRKSKYRSLKDALKRNQSLITRYKTSSNGKLMCLFKHQYKLIFHSTKGITLNDLDMALMIFLLRVLFGVMPEIDQNWDVMPPADEKGLGSELSRINCFRNIVYVFLLKPEKEGSLASLNWRLFIQTLSRLGTSTDKLNRYEALLIFPHVADASVKKSLRFWLQNDMQTLKAILESLDYHLLNLHQQFPELSRECDDIKSDFLSNFGKLFPILEQLPTNMLEAVMLHSKILPQEPEVQIIKEATESVKDVVFEESARIKNVVGDQHENTKKETKDEVRSSTRAIMQQQQVTQDTLASIQENQKRETEKISLIHKTVSGMESPHAEDEPYSLTKDSLLSQTDAFRILILSQPENREHEDLEEFCRALGCISWDVIIDLDHYSRTKHGLHERIAQELKENKEYQTITYSQIKCVLETDKKIIASGDKVLWFLANGCADTGVEALPKNKSGKALTAIENLLQFVFSKTPGAKPVYFWNVVLTSVEAIPGFTRRLMERLDEICQTVDTYIDCENSFIFNLYTEESFKANVPNVELDIDYKSAVFTYQDFTNVFIERLERGDKRKCYYYPGSDGRKCTITADQMVQYEVYFELYHSEIGQTDFSNMTDEEIEEFMEKERTDFLKGKPLTPHAQAIHPKCQVYVEREEMRSAKGKVIRLLEEREQWHKKHYNGHFTISHDASGGGTTTARYILYLLKDVYPCLEIKRAELQATKYLEKLFKESRKPLLVVMDDHDFTSKNADELQQELMNDHIKALVVHVERKKRRPVEKISSTFGDDLVDQIEDDVAQNGRMCEQISSELKQADKEAFRLLYKKVAKVVKATKVILFGLLAFCEEYEQSRLNEHINEGLQNSMTQQIEALAIIQFIWKYCQKPIKLRLLPSNPNGGSIGQLQDLVGYCNSDFVKEDKSDQYAVCPIHQCVVDPILQAIKKLLHKKDEPEFLTWFTMILWKTFSRNDTCVEESIPMCRHIFIERTKEGYTSLFVKDLGDQCGTEVASEVIIKFAKLYQGRKHEYHLRALYARYLTHMMHSPEKGLEEICIAANVKSGESIRSAHSTNEAAILGTYGYLFRNKANKTFMHYFVQSKCDTAIVSSLGYFQEAILAFQKAQRASLDSHIYSAEPFLGEVKVRHRLLSLCLSHICKSNFEHFRKFLKETKHELIQESDEKAIKVLETLDNLQRLNRLDEISERTSKQIVSLKFLLLKLRFDEKKTKTALLQSAAKESNICFDIGLLVRLQYEKIQTVEQATFTYSKKYWSELNKSELLTIINFVGKRLENGSQKILASNMCDHITAMIYLRSKCKPHEHPQCNMKYAIACAEQWTSSFPQDHRSFFNLGCLYLAWGIEDEHKYHMIKGVEHLTKCEDICRKNRSAKHIMTRLWAFGSSTGLNKLMPYKKDPPLLHKFQGRQTAPRSKMIGVKPFQDILKAKMYWDETNKAEDGRQPSLEFNICLRQHDPIVAFNVEKI